MKTSHCCALLGAVMLASGTNAEDARIMTVTDAAAPLPTATSIAPYHGKLPESPPDGMLIPQMPGWPKLMGLNPAGNFSPSRGLVFADMNGDGDLEIICSSTDKKIYAWDLTGALMPGFPVNTIEMAQYAPSVADMDGDGDIEIVQTTRGLTSGGRLYVVDHLGAVLPGYPVSMSNNNVASCATLYDLDNDGSMEIIVGERAWPLGYVHVFELDGSEWGGNWPVAIDHVPAATASVGDVDNDGTAEVFYVSYDSMYLIRADGTIMPGWPQQITNAQFSYQSAALADLDGDGDREIVVGAHWNAAGCYIFHHDGTGYPGWPKLLGTWTYCPPTVTDLEGDGELEILDGRAGGFGGNSDCFWAWTTSGTVKPGFPYSQSHGGGSEGPLTTADINGDGVLEIFADHNVSVGGDGFLFGVDATGNDLPGFPLRPLGFTYLNGAMIADVDGDGDYELGVVSVHDGGANVNLYDLPDMYSTTPRDWTMYHASDARGGRYPAVVPCDADVNDDGTIDVLDLLAVLAAWGTADPDADVNDDGIVDILDLLSVLAAWGPC